MMKDWKRLTGPRSRQLYTQKSKHCFRQSSLARNDMLHQLITLWYRQGGRIELEREESGMEVSHCDERTERNQWRNERRVRQMR